MMPNASTGMRRKTSFIWHPKTIAPGANNMAHVMRGKARLTSARRRICAARASHVTNECFGCSELKQTESVLKITRRRRPFDTMNCGPRYDRSEESHSDGDGRHTKGQRLEAGELECRRHFAILRGGSEAATFVGAMRGRPGAIPGAAFEGA